VSANIDERYDITEIECHATRGKCSECSWVLPIAQICQTCQATLCSACVGHERWPWCEMCGENVFHCATHLRKVGDLMACAEHAPKMLRIETKTCKCGAAGCELSCWECDEPICSLHSVEGHYSTAIHRRKIRCAACAKKLVEANRHLVARREQGQAVSR
jgi:hypothetical protein